MNVMKDVGHMYDITEWNNEPDEQAVWFHESRAANNHTYKIVVDFHDLDSIRLTRPNKDEVRVFRLADGLMFVSEPCRKLAYELYDFGQPSSVFAHYCNRDIIEYEVGKEDIESRSGIVYEGGLNPPDHMVPPEYRKAFRYRTMYPLMKEAVASGNEVFIYAGNPQGYQSHLDIGATVFPPTEYDDLMSDMRKYKWGWLLFGEKDDPQTKNTTANKFFEYIKCGVVPIVCWAEESAKWAKKFGCGIALKDPSELGNIEKNFGHLYPRLKARVDEINTTGELDSENHIWKVEKFWDSVLHA
jgi:hypothetical protein